MKKNYIIYLLILVSFQLFSQESIIDKIAIQTCEYLASDEVKSISEEGKRNQKLGVFIMNLYNKHTDELLKEGFEIDFSKGSKSGREFGVKVGTHMAKFCPETLMALASNTKKEKTISDSYEISGRLIKTEGEEFSTVILKDEDGKIQKFLWLQNFKGSDKLIQSADFLKEKPQVKIVYKNLECFSPQLQEYIVRKEIIEMIFNN
ncbi:hypothetical protein EC396_02035 [Lutibacter sp. HS1-25]|uniref:hypothetical protein n=1 Tax=Lutibacter sp. HS1-25 TaxID=2485000 RepID=UPI001011E717|nr:hypothetical protein [Lutibacter sp. HS1-25]RXP63607.1 hypothetical protein EC396_02035 [Lutibacter sp. HS1-25]